jgi:hypothetical protein
LQLNKDGDLFMGGRWEHSNTQTTYTWVNPGGGAYYSNTFNGMFDAFISKFTGAVTSNTNTFAYPTPVCKNFQVTATANQLPGFTGGGAFKAAPVLSINPVSGQVNISGAPTGTYLVTYVAESCQCITSTAVLQIIICGGVEEQNKTGEDFILSSNPNNGIFTLSSRTAMQIFVYDATGRLTGNYDLNEKNNFTQMGSVPAEGVYYATSSSGTSTKKMVVLKE